MKLLSFILQTEGSLPGSRSRRFHHVTSSSATLRSAGSFADSPMALVRQEIRCRSSSSTEHPLDSIETM